MTYLEAVHRAKDCLEQHQVPDADNDALLLLLFVCGIGRAAYYACRAGEMSEEDLSSYREIVLRRAQRIPLQQLTGEAHFMGLPFYVSEDVLIPRQDTETLVEEALRRIAPGDRVLDLCTGSGCILISLLKLGNDPERGFKEISGLSSCGAPEGSGPARSRITGCATDISQKALAVARRNALRHGADASFLCSDLFGRVEGIYDMIVSNPPYIRSEVIGTLMEEVRDHEPRLALDGGTDGLAMYRRIIPESLAHLREGGWLLVETGYDQGEAVRSIFDDNRYVDISVIKDLGGQDRVVLGRKAVV